MPENMTEKNGSAGREFPGAGIGSYTAVDAIAVKIITQNRLVTGVGNELHIHTDSKSHVLPPPLRLRSKVHGFEVGTSANHGCLLVYGEKEFMLMRYTEDEGAYHLLYKANLTDWVSAGRFLGIQHQFVLVTAHSVALHLRFDEGCQTCHVESKSSCTDKSTLYCSYIHGDSLGNLVIFGGNALGELLIWQPSLQGQEAATQASLQRRVQAHKGVIFSIDYMEKESLLATTSDDRSVTFWYVQGSSYNWADAKITRTASGFGHVARVFQGKFIRHGGQLYAVTAGEDSYVCLWRVPSAELIFKRRQQFGAKIWNVEFDEATSTLFTVGSTGNVLAYGLRDAILQETSTITTMLPAILAAEEYVAKVRFLTEHLLLGVSNRNRWFLKRVGECPENEPWFPLELPEQNVAPFKCTVLEVHGNLVAICGHKRLTLLRMDNEAICQFSVLFDGPVLAGAVRAFHFLSATAFLITDALGNCLLVKGLDSAETRHFPIKLAKCREPWLTAALLLSEKLLLVSNRQGNVLLYHFEPGSATYELSDSVKQLHGNMGATKLIRLPAAIDEARTVCVQSAGRDGSLKLLHVALEGSTLSVCARENVPIAWVEDVVHIEVNAPHLLIGFNDNHFVAWSRDHDLTAQVACGGGHRCWHYTVSAPERTDARWLQLAFVKNKQVRFHRIKLFNQLETPIRLPQRNTWHNKPCNAAALWSPNREQTLLISAGDDNLIKVSSWDRSGGSLTQLTEVHSHISSVRVLKVLRTDSDSCLVFSGGGRAQLCATQLTYCRGGVYAKELLSHTIAGRPRIPPPIATTGSTTGAYNFDPETRLMAIDVLPSNGGSACSVSVYLGCSDGWVRCLRLQRLADKWLIVPAADPPAELFSGECVLQVRLVKEQYVLVAGTSGRIRFYDLQLAALLLEVPHHASGVNALDVCLSSCGGEVHLLSGGDDQAVVYSAIDLTHAAGLKVRRTEEFPRWHTAQVTSVLLRFFQNRVYAFSSGLDQDLKRFPIDAEISALPTPVDALLCAVADIKGLCLHGDTCYVYGCGLQIHTFPLSVTAAKEDTARHDHS